MPHHFGSILTCPQCKTALTENPDTYTCSNGHDFPITQGVPQLYIRPMHWHILSRDQMTRLLDIARTKHWKIALNDVLLAETDQGQFDYATSDKKASFIPFLPKPRYDRILDAGCLWGNLTMELTKIGTEVYGIDTNAQTLEFAKVRAQQNGISHIRWVRVDPFEEANLPFESGSFDLIVISKVIQWIGNSRESGHHQKIQHQFLQEVGRLLKPGGTLFMLAPNRFAMQFVYGANDYSGHPYTSLIPRWLATFLMQRQPKINRNQGTQWADNSTVNRQEYATYSYSKKGYETLLRQTGFNVKKVIVPQPFYTHYDHFEEIEKIDAVELPNPTIVPTSPSPFFRKILSLLTKLIRLTGNEAFWVSGFGFISEKK